MSDAVEKLCAWLDERGWNQGDAHRVHAYFGWPERNEWPPEANAAWERLAIAAAQAADAVPHDLVSGPLWETFGTDFLLCWAMHFRGSGGSERPWRFDPPPFDK
jgi:hypothetical protein